MSRHDSEDVQFQVLRLLERQSDLSQRQIATALGVNFGGVNYCLKTLIAKGHVKVQSFRSSNNKLRHAYLLTPSGIAQKSGMTDRFLKRKIEAYEMLRREIKGLQCEVSAENLK